MAENVVPDLEEIFNRAAKHVQALAPELDTGQLLGLYGLYKQATIGPCNVPRPNWYQTQAKHKWESWNSLGNMTRDTAMDNYINAVVKLDSTWEKHAKIESQGWVTVSRLPNTEDKLDDVDKTFLDWVKEGNEEKVQELLLKDPTLVNAPDQDALFPIHWAADRGHVKITACLKESGADINSQDSDGQTPLHYAASCGHIEVVQYLLSVGAVCIKDNDGLTPKDVADKQLVSIL